MQLLDMDWYYPVKTAYKLVFPNMLYKECCLTIPITYLGLNSEILFDNSITYLGKSITFLGFPKLLYTISNY